MRIVNSLINICYLISGAGSHRLWANGGLSHKGDEKHSTISR